MPALSEPMDESYVQGIRLFSMVSVRRGSSALSGSRRQGIGMALVLQSATQGPSAAVPERLAYSVDEAAIVLGVARETIYELIRTGELRSRKAGSRRIIGRHHLIEFLDGGESITDRPAG